MSKIQITKDDFEKFHEYGCLIPQRIIYFGSVAETDEGETGVDYASSAKIIKSLLFLDQKKKDLITVHYNSPGGDFDRGMAIHDCIKGLRSDVRFVGYGCVRSMGSLIIQACKFRYLTPSCRFMIHAGDSWYGGTTTDFVLNAKEHQWSTNKMVNVYYEQMIKVNPNITKQKIAKMCEHDCYMSGEKAVELGLADKVLK